MYPVLFRIGGVEITSFGVMVGVAALVALWIFQRELARRSLPAGAVDAGLYGVMGGLAGAKLLWVAEHLGESPFFELLFSRGGLSWYGGLIGGVGVGVFVLWRGRVPLVPALAAATPALAIGHLVGRIGCFLVGDDYGYPTDVPWAVAFPEGLPPTVVPVHPTQLYEAAALGVLAATLISWRRRNVADVVVLGRYLVLAGGIRFAIEFWRVNERVALGLSVAHLISLAVVVSGLAVIVAFRRSGTPAPVQSRRRDARRR